MAASNKPHTSFDNDKKIQKKATDASHSKEAEAKRSATRAVSKAVRTGVYDSLRNMLLDPNKKGQTYYEEFLSTFLKEAKTNPNSHAASVVAETILKEDILEKLDTESEKLMARDYDFIRYRVLKQAYDKQRDVLLDRNIKRKCICTSRRAGKTTGVCRIMVDCAVIPNSPILYIHTKFENAINQAFEEVLAVADEAGLPVESSRKGDGIIKFSNGSTIYFKGNNNKAAAPLLRGGKYKLIVVDEAQDQCNMVELIEDVCEPMLVDYADSCLILQGTPPRVPHTYFEGAYNNKEWKQYHFTMLDNPFLPDPQSEIDRVCREKGLDREAPLIKREYFGEWFYDTEAQVYKDYKTYTEIPADFQPTNIAVGVDFGFSDYNSIIPLAYNVVTKQAYIIQEKKFNKSTIGDITRECRETYEFCKKFALEHNPNFDFTRIQFFCDTNEQSITQELAYTYGLPAYNCYKHDKPMAMAQLAEWCRTARVLIPENGILADEFERTVYKRDEQDNIVPEIDDNLFHPDAADALIYASRQYAFDCGEESGGESTDKRNNG